MPSIPTFHQCLTFNEIEKRFEFRRETGELKTLYDFQHMLKIMHELHNAMAAEKAKEPVGIIEGTHRENERGLRRPKIVHGKEAR